MEKFLHCRQEGIPGKGRAGIDFTSSTITTGLEARFRGGGGASTDRTGAETCFAGTKFVNRGGGGGFLANSLDKSRGTELSDVDLCGILKNAVMGALTPPRGGTGGGAVQGA